MEEVIVTKDNFQKEVLQSEKPVVVDFWASWCGPCRMIAPVLSEIAKDYPEIKICKVNVDEQMELAQNYNVLSIPYLVVFKNGEIAGTMVGYHTKEQILEMAQTK